MNYYNDNDPYCCEWLRNLISAGLIPPGNVDERSIADVRAGDLAGYVQCHFFAGVGGWSLALQLAGWNKDRPCWTGSCPCQPLSCAGQRKGEKDNRHLWPEFHRLIRECKPSTIFGEQVGSPDGLEWLDGISLDLEELGYAVGTSDLPAAGVGAPHKRQRVFWGAVGTVAHAEHDGGGQTSRGGNRKDEKLMGGLVGWRSPDTNERRDCNLSPEAALRRIANHHALRLSDQATLAGWCSPTAQDHSRGGLPPRATDTGVPLSQQAALAGWASPQVFDSTDCQRNELAKQKDRAERNYPGRNGGPSSNLREQVLGAISPSSPASTANPGALNPAHSRWLQGYPVEWDLASPGWGEWAEMQLKLV